MTIESEFVAFSSEKLLELAGRIEICAGKLTAEQLWTRGSENQNAVGNLLLHLNGNVRQWILTSVGGHADTRDRPSEFAAQGGRGASELLAPLRATVADAVKVLRAVPAHRMLDSVTVQGYDTTVLGAIYHVVEHFAGHAFQIFLLTKAFTGEDLRFYDHLSAGKSA